MIAFKRDEYKPSIEAQLNPRFSAWQSDLERFHFDQIIPSDREAL
jgi:hypothetical protein